MQPESDSDEDPLDAYMAGIEKEVKKQSVTDKNSSEKENKGIRDDIDEEDDEESYYRYCFKVVFIFILFIWNNGNNCLWILSCLSSS